MQAKRAHAASRGEAGTRIGTGGDVQTFSGLARHDHFQLVDIVPVFSSRCVFERLQHPGPSFARPPTRARWIDYKHPTLERRRNCRGGPEISRGL